MLSHHRMFSVTNLTCCSEAVEPVWECRIQDFKGITGNASWKEITRDSLSWKMSSAVRNPQPPLQCRRLIHPVKTFFQHCLKISFASIFQCFASIIRTHIHLLSDCVIDFRCNFFVVSMHHPYSILYWVAMWRWNHPCLFCNMIEQEKQVWFYSWERLRTNLFGKASFSGAVMQGCSAEKCCSVFERPCIFQLCKCESWH